MSRVTERRPKRAALQPEHLWAAIERWTWFFEATDRAVEAWINRPRIGDTRPSTGATFKPRDHFRADGTVKMSRTRANAERYCQENPEYRWYHCSVCGAHHVGHDPNKRIKLKPAC